MLTHTVNIVNLTIKEMSKGKNYEAAHSPSLLGRFNEAVELLQALHNYSFQYHITIP